MSQVTYDPTNWLVTASRALKSFVELSLDDPDVVVEMSFPDTRSWEKQTPLAKCIIHFEQDAIADPILGFGNPGVEVIDIGAGTSIFAEAAQHSINYDVGVWVSTEMGGATKRMELVQALKDLFTGGGRRAAFNKATGGLNITSFEGGRNELDRVNDVPVWRALDMTLIVKVFSKWVPEDSEMLVGDFTQDQELTIINEDGHPQHLDGMKVKTGLTSETDLAE